MEMGQNTILLAAGSITDARHEEQAPDYQLFPCKGPLNNTWEQWIHVPIHVYVRV